MRPLAIIALSILVLGSTAGGQVSEPSGVSKTFLVKQDLVWAGAALGATALLSVWDDDIARASQRTRRNDPVTGAQLDGLSKFSTRVSKVNETTLTAAGIIIYGAGRLFKAPTVTDIALHATEAVVLGSVASQIIRGPLGRSRPYVTTDRDQYDFRPFGGFFADTAFDYRSFPSIHTSSSMAVATVLVMETHRRNPSATPFLAPVMFAAGMLPGLARIRLDQHWASDIASGAFMGVFAGYKVVSYSHAHPNNRFDQFFLRASVVPDSRGRMMLVINPTF